MKQIQERYGGDPLPGFYALHRDLFPDQYAAEEKAVFPHGLQPATLASFTASPSDGALITTASPALDKGGLRKGDVIVALDGYATHDDKQYTLVRQFSDAPVLDLIVWRDGKYFETKASPPDRLFGVGFIKYQP
jgi:S1-C subfamily serine protease